MTRIAGPWTKVSDYVWRRPGREDAVVFVAQNATPPWYCPLVRGRLFKTAEEAMGACDEMLRDIGWTLAEPELEPAGAPSSSQDPNEWLGEAMAQAVQDIDAQKKPLIDVIEDFAGKLQHCEKGTCMCPATRYASYRSDGNVVAFQPSCDRHGTTPTMQHPQAELVHTIERTLRTLGREPWWLTARDG